jgi:uncharacterized protein YbjT (DUF2867 family)
MNLGASLFQGTLDDAEALSRAAAGCSGLFLNLMPSFQDDSEIRQAKVILEAAKAANVKHVVYSTSISVGRHEQSEHWDPKNLAAPALLGKHEVEEMIRHTWGGAKTILRPGYFMTNFLTPLGNFMFPELQTKAMFVSSYKPDTNLPLIDPDDIGAFTLAIFQNPGKFNAKEIQLAGEKLTVEQIVLILAKVAKKSITVVYRTGKETDALAKENPMVAGQVLSLDMDRCVDIEQVKEWNIPVTTFSKFLEREHDRVEKTFRNTG